MYTAIALAAKAADPNSATITVAVVGITATALTALLGIGAQMWLARQARKAERRRKRYDELVAVYSEVGRGLSAGLLPIVNAIDLGDAENPKLPDIDEAMQQLADDARTFEARHYRGLLRLHDADPLVLDALKQLAEEVGTLAGDEVTDLAAWWDGRVKAIEEALREYYRLAGIHARRVLDKDG